MITVKDYNILTPVWKLVRNVYVKEGDLGGGAWRTAKEVHIKNGDLGGGSFIKVYNNNVPPSVNQNHQHWHHALDPNFTVVDANSGGSLSSNLYYTFWSTGNTGSYLISGGSARININQIDTISTSESRSIFCNFTNGSDQVVTFNTNDLDPFVRTGINNSSYLWNISAATYTQSNTVIPSNGKINSNIFRISKPAIKSGTGIIPTISRTYPSNYYGLTRMISNYELAVSPGQTYSISTSCISGLTDANTRWGINVYTSNISGQAVPFGTNSIPFESPTYGGFTAQTYSFTIPSGHSYLRVGLFVVYNNTTIGTAKASTPQWARFDYLGVRRTS